MQDVGQDKALPFLANQRRQRVAYAGLQPDSTRALAAAEHR
jgi:hypothetical protein